MNHRFASLAVALTALAAAPAQAIVVTATQDTNQLITALLSGANTGIIVRNVTLNGQRDEFTVALPDSPGANLAFLSSGTYSNASGTYGVGPGVVLSTGSVNRVELDGAVFAPGYGDGEDPDDDETTWAYGNTFPPPIPDPNSPPQLGVIATPEQEALLDPITGGGTENYDHYDVTELLIEFDMAPGVSQISFNVAFGSDEFPSFVGSAFIDGFGMFLNGQNIAFVGGQPVNINHPDVRSVDGTILNGLLAPGNVPLLTFGGAANPTGNTLRFIVADTSDAALDTTVYFSALAGVPLPASVWFIGTGVAALAARGLRRRRAAATA